MDMILAFLSFSNVMNIFDVLFLFINSYNLGKNTKSVKPEIVRSSRA